MILLHLILHCLYCLFSCIFLGPNVLMHINNFSFLYLICTVLLYCVIIYVIRYFPYICLYSCVHLYAYLTMHIFSVYVCFYVCMHLSIYRRSFSLCIHHLSAYNFMFFFSCVLLMFMCSSISVYLLFFNVYMDLSITYLLRCVFYLFIDLSIYISPDFP